MNTATYEGRDLEVLANMPNYYAWIMDYLAPCVRGDVVEYGSGIGTMSALLAKSAGTLALVEPSSNLIEQLRLRFAGHANVEVRNETLEAHVTRLSDGAVDTVVMVNVLEHIEDDRKALFHSLRVLKSGGHLVIFVPALQLLMSRLDQLLGHFRRYHKPDLINKIAFAEGDVLICRYFDLAGVAPWFFLNKLLGMTTFNPTLVRIHDQAIVPLSRVVERVIAPPFGKNLILVARKR